MKHSFTTIKTISLITLTALMGCEKIQLPAPNSIAPQKYLPTLTFDGQDGFDTGEKSFPLAFNFNPSQDANQDGNINVEDNLENYIPYAIGSSLTGTGRTGLSNRGVNNQKPAVYFHYVQLDDYDVYEYWFYYADNDWLNDHEHDWEKMFVYEQNGQPLFVKISSHDSFNTHQWGNIQKDNNHPILGVDGGSHAFKTALEDGVKIRFNGEITKNGGQLGSGNNTTATWFIFSNVAPTIGSSLFSTSTTQFYYGDPYYSTNNNEIGDVRDAPWIRPEWNNPMNP